MMTFAETDVAAKWRNFRDMSYRKGLRGYRFEVYYSMVLSRSLFFPPSTNHFSFFFACIKSVCGLISHVFLYLAKVNPMVCRTLYGGGQMKELAQNTRFVERGTVLFCVFEECDIGNRDMPLSFSC